MTSTTDPARSGAAAGPDGTLSNDRPAALAADMAVLAVDGPVGRIDSVVVSPRTNEAVQFVVELAFHPKRLVVIPTDWVARIEGDTAWLAERREQALTLPRRRRDAEGWLRPAPIEAATSPAPPVADAVILDHVKGALANDALTVGQPIGATVHNGIVHLTGRARTAAAAFQAARLARDAPGVWLLRNQIIHDEALYVEIRRQILLEPALAGQPIQIIVLFGAVTLRGQVRDTTTAATARELAEGVAGVTSVTAELASEPI